MRFFDIILLTLVFALTTAKKRSSCREPVILKDFVGIEGIVGHWYEYSRSLLDFEAGCDCTTFEVVAIDAINFEISSCCQRKGVSNETQTCSFGVINATHTNAETKEATFTYRRAETTIESRAWILDTDYDNYMVLIGCDRFSDNEEREAVWILSRDKEIDENEVWKISTVLEDNNFDRSTIIRQRHGAELCTSKIPENARRNVHYKWRQSHHGI